MPCVVGSLATSGSYRQCSVVVHMTTDRSLITLQWMLRIGGVRDGNGYPKPEYPTGFTR
jgi:hypothetical protein